jgi:hypothetical protein
MQAVADNKLIFRPDLHVAAWLKLTIAYVIFFHPHEGDVGIGFAVAVPVSEASENLLLGLIFLQTQKQIFAYNADRFLQWFVLGPGLQFRFQLMNSDLQLFAGPRGRLTDFGEVLSHSFMFFVPV